jgi:SAM-dependent MidA family methyltransferase
MPIDLPEPSPDEREHSERLADVIRTEIALAGGALDFARYMELALYAPGLGYYSAGATKFGASGDFVTAPELGFLFARCLAHALAPTLRETHGDILELGPGSGILAADLLRELERLDALPGRYRLLERSADLRERQYSTVMRHCAHLQKHIEWLDAPPQDAWCGCLIANEVIDALPVRLFALREEGLFERAVGLDAQQRFVWRERVADAALSAAVDAVIGTADNLPRPYLSEVRPLLAPWFAAVARRLQRGTAIFVDYGYSRPDYYAPQRREGTLRCHYRHRAHDDPLILPGLQDITAWVNFDALAEAAAAEHFEVIANASQAEFLIAHNLNEIFSDAYASAVDQSVRYKLAQEVKRLTLPGQMGEAFRVLRLDRRKDSFRLLIS